MNYLNFDKVEILKHKMSCNIFRSSDKSKFFIINCFQKTFFTYRKISKDLSDKYYQYNKEKLQKKARKKCQSFSKEEKQRKQQY